MEGKSDNNSDEEIKNQDKGEKGKIETDKELYFKTGIQGFDELIDKGIPSGSQVLVSGGPGTLKTTFCMQILVNKAKQGKKALFLSFEESQKDLLRNVSDFNWDIKDLIKQDKLRIRNLDPFKMSRSVETLLAQARGELMIDINEIKNLIPEDYQPDFIVVDSLSAISAGFFGKEEGYRAYISQIFDTLKKLEITAFLIAETEHSTTKYSRSGVEEFLADGVFVFYNLRQGSERVNSTEIIKLRGTPHKKKIVPIKVAKGTGISVYPNEEVFLK